MDLMVMVDNMVMVVDGEGVVRTWWILNLGINGR